MKNIVISQREKQIFVLAVTVCSVYILYLAAYVPFKKETASLKAEIFNARKQLNKNVAIIRQNHKFDEKYQSILTDFKQKGTDGQVMAAILSEIESVNEKIDVTISDKKPRKSKTVDFYNQFAVSLTLDGQLSDITNFVYTLQNSPHFFRVDELRLDKKSRRTSALRCQLVVSRILIP